MKPNNKKFQIKEKIYWKNISKNKAVKWDGSSYWFDGAMVFWFGVETFEAQRFLNERIVG